MGFWAWFGCEGMNLPVFISSMTSALLTKYELESLWSVNPAYCPHALAHPALSRAGRHSFLSSEGDRLLRLSGKKRASLCGDGILFLVQTPLETRGYLNHVSWGMSVVCWIVCRKEVWEPRYVPGFWHHCGQLSWKSPAFPIPMSAIPLLECLL